MSHHTKLASVLCFAAVLGLATMPAAADSMSVSVTVVTPSCPHQPSELHGVCAPSAKVVSEPTFSGVARGDVAVQDLPGTVGAGQNLAPGQRVMVHEPTAAHHSDGTSPVVDISF